MLRGIELLPGVRRIHTSILGRLAPKLHLPEDDLVCYYVPWTQRYCIGRWLSRSGGHVQELCSFGRLADLNHYTVRLIRYRLSSRSRDDVKQAIREQASGFRSQETDKRDRARERESRFRSGERRRNIHKRGHLLRKVHGY